jgi:type IV pilus assembly protein PilV
LLVKMSAPTMNRPAAAHGFTLLEVLVALAIVAIGMLAVTCARDRGLRTSRDALLRTDATMLAADLGERIRTNRRRRCVRTRRRYDARRAGVPAASGECSASDVAALDLYQWQRRVLRACRTR